MNQWYNFMADVIFIYCFTFVFKKIGNYKSYKFIHQVYLIVFTILLDMILYNMVLFDITNMWVRILIYYAVVSLGMYYVYSRNKAQFFIIFITILSIFQCLNLIVGYLLHRVTTVFQVYSSKSEFMTDFVVGALMVFGSILLKRFQVPDFQEFSTNKKKILWVHLGAILISYSTIIYYFSVKLSTGGVFLLFVLVLVFLVSVLASYTIFFTLNELSKEKVEKNNIQLYMNMVEESLENIRVFQHDCKSVLSALSGFIENNDMEGLKKYFYENLLNDYTYVGTALYEMANLKNNAVKGMLHVKISRAIFAGVQVNLSIIDPIKLGIF